MSGLEQIRPSAFGHSRRRWASCCRYAEAEGDTEGDV
jgi:hypothetical protein